MAWYDDRGFGGGAKQPPDLDDVLKRANEFFMNLRKNIPGLGAVIVIVILIFAAFGSFYIVAPEEVGVVKRFGRRSE